MKKYFKGLFGKEYKDSILYNIYTEDPMNFNLGVLEELRTGYMFKDIENFLYADDKLVGYTIELNNSKAQVYDITNKPITTVTKNMLLNNIENYTNVLKSLLDLKEDIILSVTEDINSNDYPPFISERAIEHAIRNSQIYSRESKSKTYNGIVNSPSVSRKMNTVIGAGMYSCAMLGADIGSMISNPVPIKYPEQKHWKEIQDVLEKHWKDTQDVLDKEKAIKKAELKREIKKMKKSGKVDKETLGIMQKQYREL